MPTRCLISVATLDDLEMVFECSAWRANDALLVLVIDAETKTHLPMGSIRSFTEKTVVTQEDAQKVH